MSMMYSGFIQNLGAQAYVITENGNLYEVYPSNCTSILIGNTGHFFTDIALDPITLKLYGVDTSLFEIDINTAAATLVCNGSYGFNALTFSDDGTLYAMNGASDELYTININNCVAQSVGSTGTNLGSAGDLTFYQGNLYLAAVGSQLVKIDHLNPIFSVVLGQIGSLSSILGVTTIGCNRIIYAFEYGDIYRLGPSNLLLPTLECSQIYPENAYGATSLTETIDRKPLDLGPDTSICQQSGTILNAYKPNATYTWSDGSTDSTLFVDQAGTYWAEIKLGNCIWSDTINISIISGDLDLGNDTVICTGEYLNLNIIIPGATYLWSNLSNGSSLYIDKPGTYWAVATVGNCRWTDTIKVFPSLNVDIGNDTALCPGEQLILNTNISGATYLWSDNTTEARLIINSPGVYWVQVNKNGCFDSDTIHVHEIPEFIELIRDTVLCKGESYLLNAYFHGGKYLWSNGSTDSAMLISQPGIYWVNISHECGTYLDSSVVGFYDCFCKLFVPNTFTPNGDGINDVFRAQAACKMRLFNIEIYDRWGERVFYSTDINSGWNGKNNEIPAPTGIYVYKMIYQTQFGSLTEKYGQITILK